MIASIFRIKGDLRNNVTISKGLILNNITMIKNIPSDTFKIVTSFSKIH